MTKSKTKKTKVTLQDVQCEVEVLPPTVKDNLTVEPTPMESEPLPELNEIQKKTLFLCQSRLIADQSTLVTHALNTGLYKFEDMKHYGVKLRARANKFFLVYNDLASHLIAQKEMVLINDDGSWWFTLVDDTHHLYDNKALQNIIKVSEQMIADQEAALQKGLSDAAVNQDQ